MRVLLVDDEQLALDFLEVLLNKISGIEIVGKYLDSERALHEFAELQADLVFLDMEMGELHGLTFADELLTMFPHVEIVFVTAHSHFALEAFEVNATDYLLKPVTLERLKKSIKKIEKKRARFMQQASLIDTKKSVYIKAFGSFSLFDSNHQLVKWRTKKVKELFTYLWHHQEKPLHKSVIIEDLWTDIDMVKATTLLHTTVYQLRKTLKEIGIEKPVLMLNEQYTLNVSIDSDVQQFEQELEKNVLNWETVETIMQLYKGDYLEIEDYYWASQRRQDLSKKYLDVLEIYILHEVQKGNLKQIGNHLEKMVELDPYNEMYIRMLLECYGKTKHTQNMMSLYEKIEQKWIEELGVELPEEVTRTYKSLLKK